VAALGTENCGNRDANGLGEALEPSGPSVRAAVLLSKNLRPSLGAHLRSHGIEGASRQLMGSVTRNHRAPASSAA